MTPSEESAKPGRSEEAPDAQEQQRCSEQVRRVFADAAPKRHLKPSRSDDTIPPHLPPHEQQRGPIPEFLKLQSLLQAPDQIVVEDYPGDALEEYVETEYYKDLNAVDKTLHHTTGTGFIQLGSNGPPSQSSKVVLQSMNKYAMTNNDDAAAAMEEFVETEYYKGLNAVDKSMHHTTGTGFIQVESTGEGGANYSCIVGGLLRTSSNCNPATNDWIPAEPLQGIMVDSEKPHRSEG